VMEATLALFAASLALSLFVAFASFAGEAAAWAAAVLGGVAALFFSGLELRL
jgi:hypothetical protein